MEEHSALVYKWQLMSGWLVEGLYPHQWFGWRALSPSVVRLKGFTPTVFWFISRDVTPNKECWVFVLRCRATSFFDLPNLVSTVLPLYYPMSFIHVHSFMHIQHAYKYHSCMVALSVLFLIVQKVSSIMCLIHKCYQSSVFQEAGPTKTVVYQCLFISPVFSPVWSLPHWGNWRYFLSYVGRYPIEVIDGISFRMLVVTPLR